MKQLRNLLALCAAEALGVLLWILLTPSESGSRIFLWLSAERLGLAAGAAAVCLAVIALWLHTSRSPSAGASIDRILEACCVERGMLGAILLPLFALPLLLLVGIAIVLATPVSYAVYRALAPDTFPQLHSIVLALAPLLTLLALISLEAGIFLAVRYPGQFRRRDTWSWQRILPALTLVLVVASTTLHWIILVFQLRLFTNIRAWYWKIEVVPFSAVDLLYLLLVLVMVAAIVWLGFARRRNLLALALIALLGWFLQMGVGIMGGGGLATLRARYFSTYHKAYVSRAAESNVGILDGVRHYEELYGGRAFTNTKPPGLMVLYMGLDHLVNGHPSSYSPTERFARLSGFLLLAYPILAVLMAPALYLFSRYLLGESDRSAALAPPLLYVLAPNFVLFSLFPDQAVYPIVFLLGVWLIVAVIRGRSWLGAFLLGAFLYLAVFFAFTMLPLYPLAGIYLLLHAWHGPPPRRWSRALLTAFAIGVGTLLLYVVFRILLQYDFLPRFARTMAINHNFDFYLRVGLQPPGVPETFLVRLGQMFTAAWINNLDFAAAVGFPIFILFVIQLIRRLASLGRPDVTGAELVLAALTLSFLVLVFAGTAQGEVPRLWLFWLPLVVLLASREVRRYARQQSILLFLLGFAEIVTMMLTFHFQDLRM